MSIEGEVSLFGEKSGISRDLLDEVRSGEKGTVELVSVSLASKVRELRLMAVFDRDLTAADIVAAVQEALRIPDSSSLALGFRVLVDSPLVRPLVAAPIYQLVNFGEIAASAGEIAYSLNGGGFCDGDEIFEIEGVLEVARERCKNHFILGLTILPHDMGPGWEERAVSLSTQTAKEYLFSLPLKKRLSTILESMAGQVEKQPIFSNVGALEEYEVFLVLPSDYRLAEGPPMKIEADYWLNKAVLRLVMIPKAVMGR